MEGTEQEIRNKAILRISEIFKVPASSLSPKSRFGYDLKASFVSDFRRNELDQVLDDIHDVADRIITKELGAGKLTIKTVEDYCDHMVRCSKSKRKDVEQVLGIVPVVKEHSNE